MSEKPLTRVSTIRDMIRAARIGECLVVSKDGAEAVEAFRVGAESAAGYQPRATPWVLRIIVGRALKGREESNCPIQAQLIHQWPGGKTYLPMKSLFHTQLEGGGSLYGRNSQGVSRGLIFLAPLAGKIALTPPKLLM
jgi:hypothetical protein